MRFLVLACLIGCADLPDLGECGNGIVEASNGEACDANGNDTESCTATCELKCPVGAFEDYVEVRVEADERLFCPDASYACGLDRICRQPSGRLGDASAPQPFDIRQVPVVGDFDNDNYDDLIGTSATSIFVRFGSAGTQQLSSLAIQEAPSTTSPLVTFDAAPSDAETAAITIAAPTEGVALLRSDGERFAPQLDFFATNIATERTAIVVRDPDAALGDVMILVTLQSATSTIAVEREQLQIGAANGVPEDLTVPDCVGVAGGAWRTVDVEVARDRRSFVVVTARANNTAWAVCRYVQSGNTWSLTTLDMTPPIPLAVTLANLDADACDELIAPAAANYAMLDATPTGCAFSPSVITVTHDLGAAAAPILAAGPIIPGGADELVTAIGVLECTSPTECVRRIEPTSLPWVDAAVVDLNGDNIGDVVAARTTQDDVDVVRGGSSLNVYRSDTAANVVSVLGGDFDGDRLGDVALVESGGMAGHRISVVFGTQDGTLAAPIAMSGFGGNLEVHRLATTRWIPSTRGRDGIDDLLIVRTQAGMPASLGISLGDAARILTTPRFPPSVTGTTQLGAVVAGRIGSANIELLTTTEGTGTTSLQLYNIAANTWAPPPPPLMAQVRPPLVAVRASATESFALGVGITTAPMPALVKFSARSPMPVCASTTLASSPREMRAVDIDGDGVEEAVLLFGELASRSIQLYDTAVCPARRLAETALANCVDVASIGPKLFALCRVGATGQARFLYEIIRDGDTFTRAAEPTVRMDGDGRFLSAGDFDGDGVRDLAVGVALGAEINLQTLRQCPAHDVRACGGS